MSKNPSSPPACDALPDASAPAADAPIAMSIEASSAEQPGGHPMTSEADQVLPPGAELVNGKVWMRNAKGGLDPLELVRPQDLLQDEIVRRLLARAEALSDQISEFRSQCFEEVAIFNELLAEQYGAKTRGVKGNQTLTTIDTTQRLQIQVSDIFTFGPELAAAKLLIDECLSEWTADSRAELRAIVDYAFQVDKEGQINRGRLLGLKLMAVADERWVRAMKAIADSMRVTGSKQYCRFHRRLNHLVGWTPVSLDAANA